MQRHLQALPQLVSLQSTPGVLRREKTRCKMNTSGVMPRKGVDRNHQEKKMWGREEIKGKAKDREMQRKMQKLIKNMQDLIAKRWNRGRRFECMKELERLKESVCSARHMVEENQSNSAPY
ncbi:hypothetical protein NDU88_005814 [Pleurodeles waltl]|uniref:Uncharacterized protein n=1 Tax=Pleurodeles waltl TaxID=8319 RepID=A0AAV7VK30_PLEWA|nr:hypothetical protein NDU88_005814 [Pleurodeles waltl]